MLLYYSPYFVLASVLDAIVVSGLIYDTVAKPTADEYYSRVNFNLR